VTTGCQRVSKAVPYARTPQPSASLSKFANPQHTFLCLAVTRTNSRQTFRLHQVSWLCPGAAFTVRSSNSPSVQYYRPIGRKFWGKLVPFQISVGLRVLLLSRRWRDKGPALWTSKFITCSTCRTRWAAGLASFWWADGLGIVTWLSKYQMHNFIHQLCIYWYTDIFINCNWVVTRWQQYSTHLQTNNTQNYTKQTVHRTTQQFGRVLAVPRLG